MAFRFLLGQGLYEPCSPNREAWFFGAELNSVEADDWNCLPVPTGAASSFDLSTITKNHEVLVALIAGENTNPGTTIFSITWYRVRDNKPLFAFNWVFNCISGGWVYCYSYLGWVDWEINENGEYYADFEVSGANSWRAQRYFTISGIEEEPEPEPPPVGTMGWISQRFSDAAVSLYEIYLLVLGIPLLGIALAVPFLWLARICADLSWDFYYFNEWVNAIQHDVKELGIWGAIKELIKRWLPTLEKAITFIGNLVDEAKIFIDNPNQWLKDKTTSVIFPWAIDHIPWVGGIYTWYTDNEEELKLFTDNPAQYLKDKFEFVILPWAIENIPFFSTLNTIYTTYTGEILLFFDDPIKWLRGKFENDVLPWAIENIPFISTLYKWYESEEVDMFFSDPLEWLWGRFADWFLGKEE